MSRAARWRWAIYVSMLLLAVWSVLVEPRWVAQRQIAHAAESQGL